jgi:hypothetical protein
MTARTVTCPHCQQRLWSPNRRIPPHANLGGRPCKHGHTEKFAHRLAAFAAAAVVSASVSAAPISFKVCGDDPAARASFKVPPGTDKLEIRCPGETKPVLTIAGCVGPKVTRVGTGADYTVTCTSWNEYNLVPKPR